MFWIGCSPNAMSMLKLGVKEYRPASAKIEDVASSDEPHACYGPSQTIGIWCVGTNPNTIVNLKL